MIPFLVLTWLRQLQQFFKKKKLRSWSSPGNYAPQLKLQQGEKNDPLAIVYMQKPDSDEQVKVQHFTDCHRPWYWREIYPDYGASS